MKKIVLTGGGTAGHVTPNIALLPGLREAGFSIEYIGSYEGIEKTLMTGQGIPYHGISSGKLRRYFDWKNFTDPFRVLKGFSEARKLLRTIRPDVLFSKGGFVSVPVVRAAKALGIPVVIHESDMTPGLANKLSYSAAEKICCNFPETVDLLPPEKAVLSGCPIRSELLSGSRDAGLAFTGLDGEKPVLMAVGGSLGAVPVNEALRAALPQLLPHFDIVHLCGKGKLMPSLAQKGYLQYEYIDAEMADLFALADIILSRAGANAICEILALAKPNLLVPLSAKASRGDQILNARSFEKQGFSKVLEEEAMTADTLTEAVLALWEERDTYTAAMKNAPSADGAGTIVRLLTECAKA